MKDGTKIFGLCKLNSKDQSTQYPRFDWGCIKFDIRTLRGHIEKKIGYMGLKFKEELELEI